MRARHLLKRINAGDLSGHNNENQAQGGCRKNSDVVLLVLQVLMKI